MTLPVVVNTFEKSLLERIFGWVTFRGAIAGVSGFVAGLVTIVLGLRELLNASGRRMGYPVGGHPTPIAIQSMPTSHSTPSIYSFPLRGLIVAVMVVD